MDETTVMKGRLNESAVNENSAGQDENLLVVTAVEGFSALHNLPTAATLALLKATRTILAIRKNYDSLHTQSIYDSIQFADDYLKRSYT